MSSSSATVLNGADLRARASRVRTSNAATADDVAAVLDGLAVVADLVAASERGREPAQPPASGEQPPPPQPPASGEQSPTTDAE